jgi:hypothetical protein
VIVPVPSRHIDLVWPQVVRHVERWLAEEGIWTSDGIKEELKAARAQLFLFVKDGVLGIWVTRIDQPDGKTIGLVWGCAGDFLEHKDEALACFAGIEQWMREKGCECIDIAGREGWARIFPGYKRQAVILRKRL